MRSLAVIALLASGGLFAQGFVPHFSGRVVRGQEFRREIGAGLVFVLEPAAGGWMIRIVPKVPCAEPGDFASVVNMPYRNRNALYLDTSYGMPASDVIDQGPTEFFFVLNCADYKRESDRMSIVLWPYTASPAGADQARAKLGSSPLRTARLTILDGAANLDQIDWMTFRVAILRNIRRKGFFNPDI